MSDKASVTDPKFVREVNKSLVLSLVRQARHVSRADLARRTHLSRSTVSAVVSELLGEGWLVETGTGESQGGRRPILLTFNHRAGYILTIAAGASHLLSLVTDLDAGLLAEIEHPFNVADGPAIGLAAMETIGRQALRQAGVQPSQLLGVGVGVPGPLNCARGTIIAPPIMPGWNEVPVRGHLQHIYGVSVYLDNDANLGALGEWRFGAGQGIDNLVFIKIATGIGCGLIIGGQIYHGHTGSAGEIGHVTIDEHGPPCSCGSYGCLEAMAGGPAIAQRAMMAIQAGQPTILKDMTPNGHLTAQDVAKAAHRGDALSLQLYRDAGRLIGIAVADVLNLFNPGRVIVGGGVSQAGDLIMASLRATVRQRSVRAAVENADIVQAALGRRSAAWGAVALVLQETFRSPVSDLASPDRLR
ncbi:MAG: ROK family transcriptional regulator [Chloroflexota bacterium]